MSKDLIDQLQRHRSYDQFLQYEQTQRTQEELRKQFKTPLGRDPPLRLTMPEPAWKTTRQYLSPRMTSRPAARSNEAKLHFTKNFWEAVKASCKGEVRAPSRLEPLPQLGTVTLPEFSSSQSDSFQYAVPTSKDYSEFNPFLRPYAHNHFFPLTFFFMDETDYSDISFPFEGFSRWHESDDSWQWRACTAESYDLKDRLFTIEWTGTTVKKKVSRVNLRFATESEDEFLLRLSEATQRRDLQEALLRCETRVDAQLSQYPEIRLSPDMEARILSGLRKLLPSSLESAVLEEIGNFYRRSVVNFVFEIEHFYSKWLLTVQYALCRPWVGEPSGRILSITSGIHRIDRPKAERAVKNLLEYRSAKQRLIHNFLRRVTQLRSIDIYGFLRPDEGARTLRELRHRYNDLWLNKIKAINNLSVEITNELCDQYPHFPQALNDYCKSQVEYAIVTSLDRLVESLQPSYAVLPLPSISASIVSALHPEVLQTRITERRRLLLASEDLEAKYTPVPDSEYGMRLAKVVIADLRSLFLGNKLHSAFVFNGPKPYFTFHLVPNYKGNSVQPAVKGIPEQEDFLPRQFRENKKSSSRIVLQQAQKSNLVLNIISQDEECVAEPDESPRKSARFADSLQAEGRLGWTSVGKDSHSLQLKPTIQDFETKLSDLLSLPLETLAACPMVAPMGSELMMLSHYRAKHKWALRQVQDVAIYSLYGPLAMVAILRQYDYLLEINQQQLLNQLIASHIGDYAGLSQELATIFEDLAVIKHKLPNKLQFGAVELNLVKYKKRVDKHGERLVRCLLEELQCEYSGLLHQAEQLFDVLMQELYRSPQTVEELQEISDYLKKGQDTERFTQIMGILSQSQTVQATLQAYNVPLTEKQLQKTWQTKVWQTELRATRSRTQIRINKARPAFIEMVIDQSSELNRTLADTQQAMGLFDGYEDLENTDEYAQLAESITATLQQSQEKAAQINFRERVLGMAETDFGDFAILHKSFQKYHSLWIFTRDWLHASEEWNFNNFRQINGDIVSAKYTDGSVLLGRLLADFEGKASPLQVVQTLQTQMRDFEQCVVLIMQLRHPALRDRHWDSILSLLGGGLKLEALTLHALVKANILAHLPEINRVCHEAINEFEIERVLARVEEETNSFSLSIANDSTFRKLAYLKGLDEAECAIREQLATISFIQVNSKYSGVFKARIEKTKITLTTSCTILKDVHDFQSAWMNLYPLLQLPEVSESLGRDAQKVEELRDFYDRQTEVISMTQSIAVASDTKIKSHVEASELIEVVSREVERIIRAKTLIFPRLLFLSTRELKLFLAAAARRGELPLFALYPGIESVSLKAADLREVQRSGVMPLRKAVTIRIGDKPLQVESWLQDLDSSLRFTFQGALHSLVELSQTDKDWWRNCEDTQVLCVVQQVLFTREIFSSLGLEDTVRQTKKDLQALLELLITEVRPIFGTPGQSNLVMFKGEGVVEQKMMVRSRLEKLVLLVLQQLHVLQVAIEGSHYDWDELLWKTIVRLEPVFEGKHFDVKVTFFDLTRSFGFEWLPLPLPLYVSNPITERCMLNLACALKNNTCGLLQGGSGCSKSETLKEMALLYGRSVLSLTMARGPSSSLMSALIGSLSTGTWMCFEEIHLLESMLMNSLVYYLPKICEAQRMGIHDMVIEGESVRVHEGFAFWAMTTQSRPQLPIRFLECFRCVALVQPDLAAVAEVRLYALGLAQAREISRRIARAITFLADDCSSIFRVETSHRYKATTVKLLHKIINCMARVLDNYTVTDNNYLVSNVLSCVLKVGLTSNEEALLDEFLTTIFRAPHNEILAGTALANESAKLAEVLQSFNLSGSPDFLRGLRALWNCIADNDRRVILVTGPPASGKSTLMQVVATGYSQYTGTAFNIHTFSGQVSHYTLYNVVYACSSPAHDLQYSCTTQAIGNPSSHFTERDWIVIDAAFIHSDGLLAIARNEVHLEEEITVNVSKDLRVISEVESLGSAAPSLLAETSIIYCGDCDVQDEAVFIREIHAKLPQYEETLLTLYRKHYPRIIENTEDPLLNVSKRVCQLLLCNWLCLFLSTRAANQQLLMDYRVETGIQVWKKQDVWATSLVQVAWLLSLVSCIGRISKSRLLFSELTLKLCKEEDPSFAAGVVSFVSKKRVSSVFDLTYLFEEQTWTTWAEVSEAQTSVSHVPQMPSRAHIFIETETTKRLKYRISHALRSRTDFVIIGPHQCGKTFVLSQVLRDQMSRELLSVLPIHILQSTVCDTVEHQIEEALEQYRPRHFGALGGVHHFAFLEDMNQDSNSVYDDLRFYMERGGWYNRGEFHAVSGVTMCLVHSYSAHKLRSLNQRALRHFLMMFKYQYTDFELQTIFSELSDDPVLGQSLYTQYSRMRLDSAKSERSWQHSTLSNYIKALGWVRKNKLPENMLRKYFGDQQLADVKDIYYVPNLLLGQSEPGFQELTDLQCAHLSARFESVRSVCNEKYAEHLKYFKEPLANPVEQKARQLYHYCQVVDDLMSGQHSIVIVERELKSVRALTYMAAETLGFKVLSTSLADLSSELINSMAEGQSSYMATDMKFAFKLMLEEAVAKGVKTLCLVTLDEETNMELPLLRNLLEFCSDLLLGKMLKSLGPYSHVRDSALYPGQLKQVAREKMQDNIILTILIRTDMYQFDRAYRVGPLEHLKHNYRSLYNVCRLLSYDRQPVPKALKVYAQRLGSVDTELMKQLALVTPKPLEEFALEQAWYLADAIKRFDEEALNKKIAVYEFATNRLIQFEQEVEKSNYVLEVQSLSETLKIRLREAIAEKETIEKLEQNGEEQMKELNARIDLERKALREQEEACESKVMQELAALPNKHGLTETTEANLLLLGALQVILYPKLKPLPFGQPEKYQSICKPILTRLANSLQEVAVKLHNIEPAQVPDLSEFLSRYTDLQHPSSPLEDLIVAYENLRICVSHRSLKQAEWLEAPLLLQEQLRRNTEAQRRIVLERLSLVTSKIAALEAEIKETEERMQEIAIVKPKVLRAMNEIKELQSDFISITAELRDRTSHLQGNSLLKAVFFVASLNSDYAGRERVKGRTQQVLTAHGIPFDEEKESAAVDNIPISPFLKDSIRACTLVWQLGLPYPVLVDPFSLAQEILGQDMEKLQHSIDMRKDSLLVDCITKGRSLLLLEPTEGMLQNLMPLLQLRYSNSIRAMRNSDNKDRRHLRLGMLNLEVHPDFRLYISLAGKPSLALSQVGTVISLEPSDPASWKTSVLLRLSKMHAKQQVENIDEPKNIHDVIDLITPEHITSIYLPGFQPLLRLLLEWAELKEAKDRKMSSDESSEGGQLQDTYLELLAIASDLSSVLQTLKLGEWGISPQMFRSLLLSACEEQISEQGFPSADQVAMFTGPILYRFVVRLLWILPVRYQNTVLLCYCLKRHCEEGLFSRTLRAVAKGLSLPFITSAEELQARWEMLKSWFAIPEGLQWNSPEMLSFHYKDLYTEAIPPEGLDIRTQAVLYCWFRQDLVPLFIETLVVQALGRRFSFLPDIDFIMAADFVTHKTILTLFFRKTYPLPWIERAAALHEVELEHILPFATKRKESKSEPRLERLIRQLGEAVGQKKWLVLEGLESLDKSEVERFAKFTAEYLQRKDANEHFRLWLLFQVTPKDIPAWQTVLKTTYRLCFREPKTVREHMMLAQELFDSGTYEVVSSKKRQMYKEYSQIDLPTLRSLGKRVTRINPMLRASVNKQLKNEPRRPSTLSVSISTIRRRSTMKMSIASPSLSFESSEELENQYGNVPDFFFYNLTLVVCAFRLRNSYCHDLPIVLTLKEVRCTIREAMLVLAITSSSDATVKDQTHALSLLFLQLIGASWDEIGFYAGLNFLKHAIMSRSKAMKFDFKDETGSWSNLRYPLYKLFGKNTHKSIEALLFEMPKQDHLQLIGQPNLLARKHEHHKTSKMAHALPSVESFSELQSLPIIQKVTELCTTIKEMSRPLGVSPPLDYESFKVRLSREERRRYSYFFIPDRYRGADYTTCIVSKPPAFSHILETFEKINEQNFDYFFTLAEEQLERISGYLTYRTAQIVSEDLETLSQLRSDKTPQSWLREGPYSLRKDSRCSNYLAQLSRPVADFRGVIDFSQVVKPVGLFTALLRASAFLMKVDVEFPEFEVQDYDGSALPEYSFLISGLWLFNATLRSQLLLESYNTPPSKMPVLRCSLVKKHKNLDTASLSLPQGILISYRRTNVERVFKDIAKEEQLAALVNSAFKYQRTDWLESTQRQSPVKALDRLNKVLCPVFPGSSATKIWMIIYSDKPQGHWSKRGVKIDLP